MAAGEGRGKGGDEVATARLDPALLPIRRGALSLLVLTTAPGAGDAQRAATYDLAADGDVLLGRAADCRVVIDDGSISRHHAILHVEGGEARIEDLGSANGTRVNGTRLAPRTPHAVPPGSFIELGHVLVVVQRASGGAAPSADEPPPSSIGAGGGGDGDDPMRALDRIVQRVAKSDLGVLVLGETGAGKEVLAERIHALSPRASKPLLRLHCAALSEALLESELFGHERGAFTGAVQQKPGLLETADGGTVLLDEIGELPPTTQVKLLRVLEDKAVLRVGGLKPRPIDVRFVAATNRDLELEVAAGRFRQDLFFRLNGITLRVPPLRERPREIEALARGFAGGAELTAEALDDLKAYSWPGNVRELRNVIERAVVLAGGHPIAAKHLALGRSRPSGATAPAAPAAAAATLKDDVEALEHQRILDALAACAGNQTQAARMLGISRGTLVARLERFNLPRPRKR